MADFPTLICVRVTEMTADPAEGSVVLQCQQCGADVWVSASSQQMLAAGACKVLCMQCAGYHAQEQKPPFDGDPVRLMEHLKSQAEAAYDRMYDTHDDRAARWEYEVATELLAEAAKKAREAGLIDEAVACEQRAEHIRKVYRHQFMRPPDFLA